MLLGIEIGGTKLQLGVGQGDGSPLLALERRKVEPSLGAPAILEQIAEAALPLIKRYNVRAAGVGFGGPIDSTAGRILKSHQVQGWDGFPLANWCRRALNLPAVIGNDSDAAGLAEARFGAGRGHRVVFYTNAGSGIGGATVIDGQLYSGGSGVASEIGHLRPGLQSDRPDQTIESLASGWGIAAAAQAMATDPVSYRFELLTKGGRPRNPESVRQRLIELEEAEERSAAQLLDRCDGRIERLTAQVLAEAAAEGNRLAREVFQNAAEAFGWALAQMVTLLSPNIIVFGGGISLVREDIFLDIVRQEIDRFVFPPLKGTFTVVTAKLGEEVVVHGALALAQNHHA